MAFVARGDLVKCCARHRVERGLRGVIVKRVAKGYQLRGGGGVKVLGKARQRGLRFVGGQKRTAAPGHALGLAQMQVGDQ